MYRCVFIYIDVGWTACELAEPNHTPKSIYTPAKICTNDISVFGAKDKQTNKTEKLIRLNAKATQNAAIRAAFVCNLLTLILATEI